LEESFAELDSETSLTVEQLRFAVNLAAMTKLNDLSVTPRDLRTQLGLSTVDGGEQHARGTLWE
jgi:hypothetical protein